MFDKNSKKLAFVITILISLTLITGCRRLPIAKNTQNKNVTPPTQLASGLGGLESTHQAVAKNVYHAGTAQEFWIFEPADPKPETAPVIVFNHGWGAMNPGLYGAWIDHIVKRGNIVIYPRYQENLKAPMTDFTPNAITAVKEALEILKSQSNDVKPNLNNFAIVGHSMGGIVSANMAALVLASGLPVPKAVMAVEPGKTEQRIKRLEVALEDLSQISTATLLLTISGDQDQIVGDTDAKKIFQQAARVTNKNYIILHSDDHGNPPLVANHGAPTAYDPSYDSSTNSNAATINNPQTAESGLRSLIKERLLNRIGSRINNRVDAAATGDSDENNEMNIEKIGSSTNALDYYGFWKLFDGLTDCAFYQKNCDYALGNTAEQRYMGTWSDGTAVKELEVFTKVE